MNDKISILIKNEIKNIYLIRGKNEMLELNLDSPLYGSSSVLDSLDLINLIVGLEKAIQEKYNVTIYLADDRALMREISPFTSIKTLSNYIIELIDGADK